MERTRKYEWRPEGGACTGSDQKPEVCSQTLLKKSTKVRFPPSPPRSDESVHRESNNWLILDTIFPPKQWSDGEGTWIQRVSSDPSTRADVIQLEQSLNRELQRRHARQNGMCPIRSELYSQCFDELIRQMTVNCGERGLLLSRVRVGIRKALLAEKAKADKEKRIADLVKENEELKKQVTEQRAKNDIIEIQEIDRQQQEKKRQKDELEALKRIKQLLMDQVLKVLTPKM
ncbi:axonemal dynein light intermediate polypeptide 1-like isoform X2 [Takifugu rubripes]|uniref:axonemal dynein light intermediate polypeptide 1-like isoform X2 n=1 Tax=Takifugu rubripes TaxID=31033 RepID=UPI0011453B68|nr:axonemal dynein light intermediate polypeptide 1-like isoform X2 [Takifugu rubripes]